MGVWLPVTADVYLTRLASSARLLLGDLGRGWMCGLGTCRGWMLVGVEERAAEATQHDAGVGRGVPRDSDDAPRSQQHPATAGRAVGSEHRWYTSKVPYSMATIACQITIQ